VNQNEDGHEMKDKRKIRRTFLFLGAYFVLIMILVNFASGVPYQILILGGAANLVILILFVFAIRRNYVLIPGASSVQKPGDTRFLGKIGKPLWVLAITYFLIFIVGLYYGCIYFGKLPTAGIVIGEILNASILISLVNLILKTYRRGPLQ